MAWTNLDNPQNQLNPILNDPNLTEEEKVRNWLVYWQNWLTSKFSKSRLSNGGEGLSNDFLASSSVRSRNYKPQSQFVVSTANGNVGVSGKEIARSVVVTTFSNASVMIQGKVILEPNTFPAVHHILTLSIDRSLDQNFTTFTRLFKNFDSLTTGAGLDFRNRSVDVFYIDEVPTAGTYYYRTFAQSNPTNCFIQNDVTQPTNFIYTNVTQQIEA